jgi:hypothetical protein
MNDQQDTRYGHSSAGGGRQDQGERKDEGWTSRQGGDQSAPKTSDGGQSPSGDSGGGDAEPRKARHDARTPAPAGTNTQGELAGIGAASDRVAAEVAAEQSRPGDGASESADAGVGFREKDARGAGTDQPPRMGGPAGSTDGSEPHLDEGAQDTESRGSGAGGFDVGVNAKVVGAEHQGVKEEA